MRLLIWIFASFRRLRGDRTGSIAPTFGLLLVPLLGSMGFAVDYSMMMSQRSRIQDVADSTAIYFLRTMVSVMQNCGNTDSCSTYANWIAQVATVKFIVAMEANDNSLNGLKLNGSTNGVFDSKTGTVNVKIVQTFTYKTAFMRLFGFPTVDLALSSTASQASPKYVQVVFLVDVSGSMGVAATDDDMAKMSTLVSSLSGGQLQGCSFACHQSTLNGQYNYVPIDFRAYTSKAGISSKIDYAVTAVKDFTTKLGSMSTSAPNHFSTSIYTFGASLNTVQDPTTDFSQIDSIVSNIDLEKYISCVNATCPAWTGTTAALNALKSKIQNVGDGSSPTSMITYLILVTDGVEDIYNPNATFGHQTDTTWASTCSAIKASGVKIATVQAQYLPLTGKGRGDYDLLVAPIASQITPAMTSCASSSDVALSASDGPGLQTAIDSLFNTLISTPRLTQ